MADDGQLPTVGQLISNWLGVQLPALPIPQTLKNIDKAISRIILAGGENVEARVKGNTARTKTQTKINVDNMFRTAEEQRKFENRIAVTKEALESIDTDPSTEDAATEIEDDWLNFFIRVSEDKSSEELQKLFGKILSGEIRRPGSFSLRTVQIMATISKRDAESLSTLLSYTLSESILPFGAEDNDGPPASDRLLLEELGIAGHPNRIGGMALTWSIQPGQKELLRGSYVGLLIENNSDKPITFTLAGQALTTPARELIKIANPPPTNIDFLDSVGREIQRQLPPKQDTEDAKSIAVHIVSFQPISSMIAGKIIQFRYHIIRTLK